MDYIVKCPQCILALGYGFFKASQLLRHHAEAMDFCSQRGVVEAVKHTVCLLLSLSVHLEYLQLLCLVHGLSIIVEDGRGVQGFGVHLVAVIAQPDDNGVWVEYDLHILHLLDITVWSADGEGDEVISIVLLEPQWYCVMMGVIASLVQGEACRCGHIWGLVWVVRVFKDTQELMLSWVKVLLTHMTGGAAPQAMCCRCTDWCSASCAAILVLLLAMALANCSSLHMEHTFLMASCDALGFLKRNWYRDFSQVAVFRSPNVGIDCVHVCLMGGGCSHLIRV